MKNVRCAGGGTIAKDRLQFGRGPLVRERPTGGSPCGWTGARAMKVYRPRLDPPWQPIDVTRRPCPRCGGRVALLPTQAETERGAVRR